MLNINFPNVGFIRTKLPNKVLSRLDTYIKNKTKKKTNYRLAGNINASYDLIDKDDFFFNEVLCPHTNQYTKYYVDVVPKILTKNCKFKLDRFWVNYQKKYEFNPNHNHGGIFSFVIWIKIPSSYKKESKLPFASHAKSSHPNTFQFTYIDALGRIRYDNYNLEPEDERTMLFFPAGLNHCVYPFYLSNQYRISISGNIALDPTNIIQRDIT